ncbi:MAG TPA: TraB/GumN family protein [Candidatus Binatia bacterium]
MSLAERFATRARHLARISFFIILSLGNAADVRAEEKSLLWKVSTDASSVDILGSIHYLRSENYPLKKAILDAFEKSKRVVFEIDLNSASPEAFQRIALEKAIYRNGTTLAQNISADTYHLAAQRATQFGIDMRVFNPMKPWFVAINLIAMKLRALGLDPRHGVDQYLAVEAKRRGKPASGLETLEFQIGLLDELSKQNQEAMLRETVTELDLLDRNIDEIVRSWLEGDEAVLAKLLLAGMVQFPEIHQKVIVERNRRWVPEIEKLLAQGGGALIVIGAAHLVGGDGVIEMLKTKGYSVEQK